MGNTSTTYRGPNGGKQKLSVEARKAKQNRDRHSADNRKEEKATAQAFRKNIKNIDLQGKDVHHIKYKLWVEDVDVEKVEARVTLIDKT